MTKDGKSQYVAGISALDDFFAGHRAVEIGTDRIVQFIEDRQSKGASNGTVNRSLAMLRRMFKLAVQSRKLREVPTSFNAERNKQAARISGAQ